MSNIKEMRSYRSSYNSFYTDYWDQTYPVEFTINLGAKSKVIYYEIDKSLSEKIHSVAESRGISVENLLSLWVQEKLQEEMV